MESTTVGKGGLLSSVREACCFHNALISGITSLIFKWQQRWQQSPSSSRITYCRLCSLEGRLRWRLVGDFLGTAVGINAGVWEWRKQGWGEWEIGLWCSHSGSLGRSFRVVCRWNEESEPLCPAGCPVRSGHVQSSPVHPHWGLTREGCPPRSTHSSWGNCPPFLQGNLGRTIIAPIRGIFQKSTMAGAAVNQD